MKKNFSPQTRPFRHALMMFASVAVSFAFCQSPALAQTPGTALITDDVVQQIKQFIDQDIVRLSILSQNEKYGKLSQEKIGQLDTQWVSERESSEQPLISSTLSNPLSSYLTRIQAHSIGLYTEMFVMDMNGQNVGQSNITSDYWQGDEAKFQKTYPVSGDAVFIDEPEYSSDSGIWTIQVSMSITDGTSPESIGAVTVEVNLSELQRRNQHGLTTQ